MSNYYQDIYSIKCNFSKCVKNNIVHWEITLSHLKIFNIFISQIKITFKSQQFAQLLNKVSCRCSYALLTTFFDFRSKK